MRHRVYYILRTRTRGTTGATQRYHKLRYLREIDRYRYFYLICVMLHMYFVHSLLIDLLTSSFQSRASPSTYLTSPIMSKLGKPSLFTPPKPLRPLNLPKLFQPNAAQQHRQQHLKWAKSYRGGVGIVYPSNPPTLKHTNVSGQAELVASTIDRADGELRCYPPNMSEAVQFPNMPNV